MSEELRRCEMLARAQAQTLHEMVHALDGMVRSNEVTAEAALILSCLLTELSVTNLSLLAEMNGGARLRGDEASAVRRRMRESLHRAGDHTLDEEQGETETPHVVSYGEEGS